MDKVAKGMGLVDYSDSDDDDQEPALPVSAPPPAPEPPPAKKVRKEINLANLLQKNDASLTFEEAGKLPADFFDSARERDPDAGEVDFQPAARGWAAGLNAGSALRQVARWRRRTSSSV